MNIDGYMLKRMIVSSSNSLEAKKNEVNELNVFPVPDGDTGTNMSMTLLAAAKEAEKIKSEKISDVAKAISSGSLRGARGNSGVILSQLFRGFAAEFDGKAVAGTDDIGTALANASLVAQKAVMKPKEGTILTVARAIGEKAMELSLDIDELEPFFKKILKHGYSVLEKTKEMLPELKNANVVDAGGLGYLLILEGMYKALVSTDEITLGTITTEETNIHMEIEGFSAEDIKFGYCTEFFINLDTSKKLNLSDIENRLKSYLASNGDSIVAICDEDIIKIHVHTNHPGNILEYALGIGTLSQIKIDNMRIQHQHLTEYNNTKIVDDAIEIEETENISDEPRKPLGFVAVSSGENISRLFQDLAVDTVIEGGQTSNPSTEDILTAVKRVNADNVIVLPNNKNIILTVSQASELCTDKKIILLPTKTIPQGLNAMLSYLPMHLDDSYDAENPENFDVDSFVAKNVENMTDRAKSVQSGQVTLAVRDTTIGNLIINEGDALCILEDEIVDIAETVEKAVHKLLTHMNIKEELSFVSIYYGKDIKKDVADEIVSDIEIVYPDIEVECYKGGQAVYDYIISAE